MSVFNEKSHAFIAAKYYEYLVDRFGDRGIKAFVHATQYYAGQRGRRMAQRAIRDGKELTFETYCQYGEWVNTEAIKEEGVANQKEIVSKSPDYHFNVIVCPWRTQFEQMKSIEAGLEYCRHLDNSIYRGFNPYLVYEVDLSHSDEGYCSHKIHDFALGENQDLVKRPENLISFEYHCAHSYWSFNEVTSAIFGLEGEEISVLVLKDFAKTYGDEASDAILKYKHTNFNVTF